MTPEIEKARRQLERFLAEKRSIRERFGAGSSVVEKAIRTILDQEAAQRERIADLENRFLVWTERR